MHRKNKLRFQKIIQFSTIWLLFGIVYSLVEKGLLGNAASYPGTGNPYSFYDSLIINCIATAIMGIAQGTIEVFFLRTLFFTKSFRKKIFLKSLIYATFIVLFVLCLNSVYNSILQKVSLQSNEILYMNVKFISSFSFWSTIAFVLSIVTVCLLFSEISDFIGQTVLNNFFAGRYHTPKTEDRIFMLLDMKNSTAIAENLGHTLFFKLLNTYYADMTDSILETGGSIYQYAGDGLIITWSLKKGIQRNNCIKCFFGIKEKLKKQSKKYIDEYGLLPGFKAGIHCGSVTAGEIGVIKKEIIFSGDVLNTTDRIQGLCNHYTVDLLLSEYLASQLMPDSKYKLLEVDTTLLRGKNESVQLFTINEIE